MKINIFYDSEMGDDRKKVCSEQLNILITEIERDPSLLNSRRGGTNSKLQYAEKWENLAKKLNSVENGVLKNVAKWQQSWRDWKSNTKKKMAKVLNENNPTDSSFQELSNLEIRVLKVMDVEQPKAKLEGIDISSITEIDPLSSDSESCGDYDHNGDSKPVFASDMFTMYTEKVKNETKSLNGRRRHSKDDAVNIKRRRTMSNDSKNSETTEILSRLSVLESSRQESHKHNSKILEAILVALERHAAAAARQAEAAEVQARAMNRIVDLLERKERDS